MATSQAPCAWSPGRYASARADRRVTGRRNADCGALRSLGEQGCRAARVSRPLRSPVDAIEPTQRHHARLRHGEGLSARTPNVPHAPLTKPVTTSQPDEGRLLTVDEVCDRLHCSRTYLYGVLQAGEMGAVKLGRLTRIPLSELEKFIAHKRASARYDICERWSRGGDREDE